MKFIQYLKEKSFNKSDIPKNFRVVIDLRTETIKELSSMKLKGVRGISASGEIAYDFLGVGRNAMIVMNGEKTLKQNNLSRFMYDNVHYFYSNNMEAMRRMYQKSKNDNRGLWHNIADYIFKEFGRKGMISKYDLQANAPGQEVSYTKAVNKKVNSVKDAVKVFRNALKEIQGSEKAGYYRYMVDILELSDKEIEKVFIDSFNTDIGPIYKSESEWTVKNSTLIIPKKSYLYVLVGFTDSDIERYHNGEWDGFEMMRNEDSVKEEIMLRNDLNKIKSSYIIKYISAKEWDRIRVLHQTKKFNQI